MQFVWKPAFPYLYNSSSLILVEMLFVLPQDSGQIIQRNALKILIPGSAILRDDEIGVIDGAGRIGTVSYTHLDVYKRQHIPGSEAKCSLWRTAPGRNRGGPAGTRRSAAACVLAKMCIRDRHKRPPKPLFLYIITRIL